jgi:hypothetical protein
MNMKTARLAWVVFAAAVLLVVSAGVPKAATPLVQDPTKTLPADEAVQPAIDPAKLAGDKTLRDADARNRSVSNGHLKQLALAAHNYAATYNNRLPADILGKDGKQLLSWRVLLLPYIEENQLFKQFKLDEPWDSKHNLPLMEKMPKIFASPRVQVKRKGFTVYQVFSGPGALYQNGKTRFTIATIPDGTSNTILFVESSNAVPWTKPADIAYEVNKPIPDFGRAYGGKPLAALGDGVVRVLDLKKISAVTLRHAIDPADGVPLGADWE